jgi:hypothetical protein
VISWVAVWCIRLFIRLFGISIAVLRNKSVHCRINELPNKCVMLLRRDAAYVTSPILPIRNVNLTLLPIDRIVLILKAELFLRTTTGRMVRSTLPTRHSARPSSSKIRGGNSRSAASSHCRTASSS